MTTVKNPILSIGMIAKNNEKTIRSCLDALSHLRERVPCQLVLADTGSTDSTPDILKEYADIYLEFPWENDFAKARNKTLEPATGEWFMFLDTDEYFTDTTELEDFFISGEYRQFERAYYTIRNFTNSNRSEFIDFYAFRLARRRAELCFEDPLHEHLSTNTGAQKLFEHTLVKHDGYLHTLSNNMREKEMRNLNILMDALKKDPDDFKLLCHIIRQFASMKKYNETLDWCEKALTLTKKQTAPFSAFCYLSDIYTRTAADKGQFSQALAVFENYLREKKRQHYDQDLVSDIDMSFLAVRLYQQKEDYERALKHANTYLRLYPLYKDKTLITGDLFFNPPVFDKPEHLNIVVTLSATMHHKLHGWERGYKFFQKHYHIDKDVKGQKSYFETWLYLIGTAEQFPAVADYYKQTILQNKNKTYKKAAIHALEQFFQLYPGHCQELYSILLNIPADATDSYYLLLRLRTADQSNPELLKNCIDDCIRQLDQWESYYFDLIYYSLLAGAPLDYFYQTLTQHETANALSSCINFHVDLMDLLLLWVKQNISLASPIERMWKTYFMEALLYNYSCAEAYPDKEYMDLFKEYTKELSLYAKDIYHSALLDLNTLESNLLPDQFRLAFLIEQADATTDLHEKLHLIRRALSGNEKLSRVFNLLLAEVDQALNQETTLPPEFLEYAAKIKTLVHQMILSGKREEAEQALTAYKQVNPNDPDIKSYEALLKKSQHRE